MTSWRSRRSSASSTCLNTVYRRSGWFELAEEAKNAAHPTIGGLLVLAEVEIAQSHWPRALSALHQVLEIADFEDVNELEPVVCWIRGRLAEELDLRGIAVAMYEKLPPPKYTDGSDHYHVATERLKALRR